MSLISLENPVLHSAGLRMRFTLMLLFLLFAPHLSEAQTRNTASRISQVLDERNQVSLAGNVHPLARPEFDEGLISDAQPLTRVLLLLQRSPAQQAALDQLLNDQQDQSSSNYHAWLTPQEFGLRFGVADADIQVVAQWLASHGFTSFRVSNSRTVVEFSGTVANVRNAFHTQIHRYLVNGSEHVANASDPQIPAALQPVVAGIVSLHDFRKKPLHHLANASTALQTPVLTNAAGPNFNFSCFDYITTLAGQCHGLGPYDFATIYNVLPLWNLASPVDGTGETIAIVGRTNINLQDVADFRSMFGLPANLPQVIINGSDPGLVPGDETEADLDVEWSGAVAKKATIKLVASQSTETTDGVDLSALYIVDNDLAPVVSASYGQCEFNLGAAGNQFYYNLWQQAAAQGITVLVSSGDNGSAGCDFNHNQVPGLEPAQYGLQVNGLASTPYNVAVGGTDFNQYFNSTNYWNSTNDPATQESAKGYIPETTWNDSCTNAVLQNPTFGLSTNAETNCNNPNIPEFILAVGGSGGTSNCTIPTGATVSSCNGGYPKPLWQAAPGVPNDQKRDLPDVSLFASNGLQHSFYVLCEKDIAGNAPCTATNFVGVGGTSASSPAFAGLMALVNQQTGLRQGNANYILYGLAATQSAANCNASSGPSGSCVFNDITNGTIAMPCVTGSVNCNTSTPGHNNGILSGYQTGTGYDLATGLGSVNAYNLVTKWSSVNRTASATTLTLNGGAPVTAMHGSPISVAVSVSPTSPQPAGAVSLVATQSGQSFGIDDLMLSNGNASGTTKMLPGGTSYSVYAHYPGDANYLASDASPTTVTIDPEPSAANVHVVTLDWATGQVLSSNAASIPYGSLTTLRVDVGNTSGATCFTAVNKSQLYACPTGLVSLALDGSPVGSGNFALNSQGYSESQSAQLSVGPHSLVGNYSGDNSYTPSSSSNKFTVVPAPMFTIFQNHPIPIGTLTTLSVAAQSSTPGLYPTPPGGTFTILDGNTPLPTTAITGNGVIFPYANSPYVYVMRTGEMQFTLAGLSGTHMLTVNYSGDANYAPSSSGPFAADAVYTTQTLLSSSVPTTAYGQPVTLTANIVPSQRASSPPTGTVTFSLFGVLLGTAPVSNSQAQITIPSPSTGTLPITATYTGDFNYAASSGAFSQTVTPAGSSTSVTASAPTVSQGVQVTLTAQINPVHMGPLAPTGIVSFTLNGLSIGASNVVNGQAQIITSFSVLGTAQIQATYSGDLNYSGSIGSMTETVVSSPPDFSLTSSGTTSQTITAGQTATFANVITVSPLYGFAAQASLTCALPPAAIGTACSVNPNSVGAGNGIASVRVTTTGRGGANAVLAAGVSYRGSHLIPVFGVVIVMAGLFFRLLRKSNHPVIGALPLGAFILLLCLTFSCGGGSGTPAPTGTPAGSYTVTVTGTSGNTTHTTTLTLIVN